LRRQKALNEAADAVADAYDALVERVVQKGIHV
jgi:hypothetical protein